jgi:uncharacterized protein (TIGR02231 family)
MASVESLGIAAVFKVPAIASIPSDGEAHRSTISIQTMKGKPEYVAQPKFAKAAFLKSRAVNSSEMPLLPGDISLFVGDEFVGKTSIPLVAPTASFDLYLGVDHGIKVACKETKKRTEQSGIIQKRQVHLRGYEIEVSNFKATPIKITLKEPLPVSQESGLIVRPHWGSDVPQWNKDSGAAEWTLELKPQEKKTISYEYEIESNLGTQVAGI